MTQDVSAAAGYVHQGAFLPQTEPRGDGQHQGDGLDDEGPLPQVAADDEATQDGFYLRDREWKCLCERGLVCVCRQDQNVFALMCQFTLRFRDERRKPKA